MPSSALEAPEGYMIQEHPGVSKFPIIPSQSTSPRFSPIDQGEAFFTPIMGRRYSYHRILLRISGFFIAF